MKIFLFRFFIFLVFAFFFQKNEIKAQSAQIWKELERLPSIKDDRDRINTMNYVGMLYQAKNADSCLYYGIKAKTLAIEIGYEKGETDADNLIGVALDLRGLYKESLEKYNSVLSRYKQQGDTENVVQVLMNMALVYSNVGDLPQSTSYFQQAIHTGRKLQQDSIMSILYVNYSMTIPSLSEDSVKYYLDKAKKITQKYTIGWLPVMIMQAEANLMLKKNDKHTLPFLQETLAKAKLLSLETLEMNSLVNLGNYYKDDPKTAMKYYQQAYDLVIATGIKNMLVPAAYVMLDTKKRLGNIEEINQAHEQLENALAFENENLKNFIGDYVKYNSIEGNNLLLEANNKSQKTKIWLLFSALIVCTSLAGFIFWQYRQSAQLNKIISEQNDNLQVTLTILQESQKENVRIMKIVAHDLRNPIGAIKLAASMISEKSIDSEEDKTILEMIELSADKSLELVNDLLSSNTKLSDIEKEPIDIQVLLEYCVNILKHKSVAKGQHIDLATFPIILSGSKEKLWRVFSNLISNAIKFSPISSTITISLEKKPKSILITIRDKGIGIPAEIKEQIFEMYTDAKRQGTSGEQPFGLGLAISKQIIEAHGGKIWFESIVTVGTTFYVELPYQV